MKQYALLLLIILLSSCAPTVEVDTAKPVETPAEKPTEAIEQPELEEPEETKLEEPAETKLEEPVETEPKEPISSNIIEILEKNIKPNEKTIDKDTEIKWVNKDKKEHKIACYLNGQRVTTSENLKQDDFFTYSFLKEGEYTCIDAIYGLRSKITVEPQALLSPTGNVILNSTKLTPAPFTTIAMIGIVTLIFFIYGRKRV